MAIAVQYTIGNPLVGGTDLALNGNAKTLQFEPKINANTGVASVNGSNGLTIVSQFLTVAKEALDTILEANANPEDIASAKFYLTRQIAALGGAINFVEEYEIQKAAGASTFKAIYVATGETVVETGISLAATMGGILNDVAAKFGHMTRFGVGVRVQL